jgi:hypothetical protein
LKVVGALEVLVGAVALAVYAIERSCQALHFSYLR